MLWACLNFLRKNPTFSLFAGGYGEGRNMSEKDLHSFLMKIVFGLSAETGFERCGVCVRWADFINFQDIGKISQASEQRLTMHVSSVVTVYESPECRN